MVDYSWHTLFMVAVWRSGGIRTTEYVVTWSEVVRQYMTWEALINGNRKQLPFYLEFNAC
jgi:hypothetical protein